MERKVKGSVLEDMVKIVRAFKNEPWEQYLQPEDLEIVNSMVIPAAWYSFESYQRISLAVVKLVAKNNMQAVWEFGRQAMQRLFEDAYKPFLDKNDPEAALAKFMELRSFHFNFAKMGAEKTGDKSVRVFIKEFGEVTEGLDVFETVLGGHFERLVELNGGRNVKQTFHRDEDEAGLILLFDVRWE